MIDIIFLIDSFCSPHPPQIGSVFHPYSALYMQYTSTQTITRFDEEVVSLHDRKRFVDEHGEPLVNFQLFDKNGGKKTFSTPYYICDGGYVFGLAYYQYNLVLEILCLCLLSFYQIPQMAVFNGYHQACIKSQGIYLFWMVRKPPKGCRGIGIIYLFFVILFYYYMITCVGCTVRVWNNEM